jgi:short-subunit dehydrogenase
MTALITGATAGIGLAFAELLADEGEDLVLVARTAERLEAIAQRLSSEHDVSVEAMPADLATTEGCERVMARLRDAQAPVDLLVNNAGFGLNTEFLDSALDEEERLLDVLVRAPLRLTHAVAPVMVARGGGRIVNVSSMATWTPIGTYSAAKAWVTAFSEALSVELAGTGVTVTAVCPGLTRTEFHERAEMALPGVPEFAWIDARTVAEEGLRAARAGRTVCVPSRRYSAAALALQWTPRPIVRRLARLSPTNDRG